MDRLELKPTDYTKDEIYTALEYLNATIEDHLEKLESLNKMYSIIEKNLSRAFIPSCMYFSHDFSFYLRWNDEINKLEVVDDNIAWHLMASPQKYRLQVETFLADAIRYFADNKNKLLSKEGII